MPVPYQMKRDAALSSAGIRNHEVACRRETPDNMQPGGCVMTLAALSRIDRSIDIAAAPEQVWRALTDAAELSVWFQVTIEGRLEPGSEVWMTSVHPQHTASASGSASRR